MATKTLLIDESEFIDFQLFGIASSFSEPTQLVYHINECFNTRFIRGQDLDVFIENQISYYPVYDWEDLISGTHYYIIKNSAYTLKSNQDFANLSSLFEVAPALISQFTQYNYFIKINGEELNELPLIENSFIQKITQLEPSKIKMINRLIF